MTWVTELAKAENDALRQAGDMNGIIAKYNDNSASPRTWADAPLGVVITVVEASVPSWTAQNWATLKASHLTAGGMVTISAGPTRSFLSGLITAEEQAQLVAQFSAKAALWETIAGLDAPTKVNLRQALEQLPDSPHGEAAARGPLITQIRDKARQGFLDDTSVANLTTINNLLGT